MVVMGGKLVVSPSSLNPSFKNSSTLYKVEVHDLVTSLHWMLIYMILYVVTYGLRTNIKKTYVWKRLACWKYNNHSRLNNQHNWGERGKGHLQDHLMNKRLFNLKMNKIFIWDSYEFQNCEENCYNLTILY